MTLMTRSLSPEVDIPEVVAEVRAAFEDYERALVTNNVERIVAAFWESERTVRYGLEECQYGSEEISRWRRQAPPVPPGRTLGPTVITTFGQDFACVNTEFRNVGLDVVGRQSQAWARRPEGWRIVSAHVSAIPVGEP